MVCLLQHRLVYNVVDRGQVNSIHGELPPVHHESGCCIVGLLYIF